MNIPFRTRPCLMARQQDTRAHTVISKFAFRCFKNREPSEYTKKKNNHNINVSFCLRVVSSFPELPSPRVSHEFRATRVFHQRFLSFEN